jgi:hypothetical protein
VYRTVWSVLAELSTTEAPDSRPERQLSYLQVGNTRAVLIGTIDKAIVWRHLRSGIQRYTQWTAISEPRLHGQYLKN